MRLPICCEILQSARFAAKTHKKRATSLLRIRTFSRSTTINIHLIFKEFFEFKTEGEVLLSNFNRLGNKRHEIIHGALTQLPQNGMAMFAKLDIKYNFHHRRSVPFDGHKVKFRRKSLSISEMMRQI